MELYTMEEITDIRGYKALTQGLERIEWRLLDNINQLHGKKARGFIKTRREVLTGEFDRKAVEDFIGLSVELIKSNLVGKRNVLLLSKGKQLCEQIFRDHVPMDMVSTFEIVANALLETAKGDIEKVVDLVEEYFTCGKIVPVAHSYREAEECVELHKKGGLKIDQITFIQ